MTDYLRYRDFIADLEANAEGDPAVRVIENRTIADICDTWLCLKPGKDGGVVFVRTRKGDPSPANAGIAFKVEPTVSMVAFAAALASPEMMSFARSMLTPGAVDPAFAVMFTDGLKDVPVNPYDAEVEAPPHLPPIKKPPSLDAALWRRIPHAQRHDYIEKMAHALVRGIHPDDTVSELAAA